MLEEILLRDGRVNPLLSLPFLEQSCFRIDWLHCADLGVAADFLGQLFHRLQVKLPGGSVQARVAKLWEMIQHFYSAQSSPDRLPNLSVAMIKAPGKHPKLKCQGAACRCLVPFGVELAEKLVDPADEEEATALHCARHLLQAYECLHTEDSNQLKKSSTRFAVLLVDLARLNSKAWRLKPKIHMWLELCAEEGVKPNMFWGYRDEDFGGGLARLARRRGGRLTSSGFSRDVIDRFRMHPMQRVL